MAERAPRSLEALIKECGLTEADCNKEVKKSHLEKICRSFCSRWRLLPPLLGVEPAVMEKLQRENSEDSQKRAFFLRWKELQGAGASYRRLVGALWEAGCMEDAEKVCKLLWEYTSSRSIPPMKPSYGMYFRGKTASDCTSALVQYSLSII